MPSDPSVVTVHGSGGPPYGVGLWMPEVGGRVDWHAEDHERTMLALGLSSKREITRTRIRVRTAMAAQTREEGRYLGGLPLYGYRLADAGPHPNKAHAAWRRRAHRLEPDPVTAPVVRWMFAQRLAGHSAARITRALNDAGIPCPSAADPGRNPHRTGARWTLRTAAAILANPRYTGRQVWNRQRTDFDLVDHGNTGLGISRCSGGTCPRAGSSPNSPRTRRCSARPTSSPPRTPPSRVARPARLPAGICWPGCWPASGEGASWSQPGSMASPPTGAVTATPAPSAPIWPGRRTPTSVKIRSSRTWPPSPSSSTSPPMRHPARGGASRT